MNITKATGFALILVGMLGGFGTASLLYALLADRITPRFPESTIVPETGLLLPMLEVGLLLIAVTLAGSILLATGSLGKAEDQVARARPWRMSVRTLLIAVAVVGVLLGLEMQLRRRAERFKHLYTVHFNEGFRLEGEFNQRRRTMGGTPTAELNAIGTRASLHNKLANKYERAAARPWEHVVPYQQDPRFNKLERALSDATSN